MHFSRKYFIGNFFMSIPFIYNSYFLNIFLCYLQQMSLPLKVQYAPKVVVSVVNGALETGQIPDGNTIDVLCAVDANPDVVTYRWFLNDEQIPDQTNRVLVSALLYLKYIRFILSKL